MLETVTLLSEKQITSQADLVPDMSGVYFLIKDGKIVYVGQARNVLSRIGEHIDTKDFDEWTWIAVTLDRLNITELAYIRHFNPPLNNDPESKARKRRLAEKTDNASL